MEETIQPDTLFKEEVLSHSPKPCIVVIFGASGDLTGRKLIPALYNLKVDGQMPPNFACIGFARREKSHDAFRDEMKEHLQKFSRTTPTEEDLHTFLSQLFYNSSNFDDDAGYEKLKQLLQDVDKQLGTQGNRIFYLSVQPKYFLPIIEKLKKHGLIYDVKNSSYPFSRVIIEKPFGHDLSSAEDLQANLVKFLDESQTYRIDHYLGKETVQNILVFRFSNAIFEGLWNHHYIDNIQITVAESIGIGTRGAFFEGAGTMRDIIQNHAMQLLSLVTMEPPINLSAEAIRDEKVKVLEAIKHYDQKQIEECAIRGQYAEGYIEGEPVKSYRQEDNVSPESNIETFVALECHLDNWRWASVPLYIRSGKRLPKRTTEIVVMFKRAPDILFFKNKNQNIPNCIIFRIQPDEGIHIRFTCKVPGMNIYQPVNMDFNYSRYFGTYVPEAYERLIYDCILGDSTLFARVDESIASWQFITPILDYWHNNPLDNKDFYPSGTWGTQKSEDLLTRGNRSWKRI